MKKLSASVVILVICLMARTVIFANDGSLRIDTSLNQNTEKTDIQYFEQDSDLAKLFKIETINLVEKLQNRSKENYDSDKTSLFVKTVKTENIIENYQPLLFTSETMVKIKDTYGVSLNQKSTTISWQMVLLFAGGLLVLIYSVMTVKEKK